jgi:cytochrome P450
VTEIAAGPGCPWPGAEVTQCPYPFYGQLRAESPVYKVPGRDDYLVTRWEDVVHVAQHPELFSNRILEAGDARLTASAWAGSNGAADDERRRTAFSMSSTDPPEHRVKRGLGLRMVTHEKLRAYEPLVRRLSNELIDRWIADGECDFSARFANLLPIEVICAILGLPKEDVERLQWLGDVEAGGAMRYVSEERLQADLAKGREMGKYVEAALRERVDRPRDDFLSEMIQAQVELDGELDLEYLTNEGTLLLFAGNVTTAHLLASMMVELCADPERAGRLRGDGPLLKQFTEEVLRLEAPVQWLQRICLEDTEVGGVAIPAGAWLILFWASGNRDERTFPRPDVLDLERPGVAKHNLVFGRGAHLCLGAPLARLEGRLAYEVLLERLADVRLAEAKSDLRNLDSVRFRAPRRVWVEFDAA